MTEVKAIQFKNDLQNSQKKIYIREIESTRSWEVEHGRVSEKLELGTSYRICREDHDDINYSLVIDSEKKFKIPFAKMAELNWKLVTHVHTVGHAEETVNVTIGENELPI